VLIVLIPGQTGIREWTALLEDTAPIDCPYRHEWDTPPDDAMGHEEPFLGDTLLVDEGCP
jgi:hypothetical protein